MGRKNSEQVVKRLTQVAAKRNMVCVPVSWEDAARATYDSQLSSFGPNIADVRIYDREMTPIYTVRSQNWDETLGFVPLSEISVVTGNHVSGGAAPALTTLDKFISKSEYYSYTGVDRATNLSLSDEKHASIRFQTVFLSASTNKDAMSDAKPNTVEFCTEVYSYNTRSNDDPRNALFLCTPQGTSHQQDGVGAVKLYDHRVDPNGKIHRYWLEAEQSSTDVGGAQKAIDADDIDEKTKEEELDAAKRGKATAVRIGTRSMGTRFNVQMLVQVPLEQKPRPKSRGGYVIKEFGSNGGGFSWENDCAQSLPMKQSNMKSAGVAYAMAACIRDCAPLQDMIEGTSKAARVSRGSEVDVWNGVVHKSPKRQANSRVTITVTMYQMVKDGVPTEKDINKAIDDIEALYKACNDTKKLSNAPEATVDISKNQQAAEDTMEAINKAMVNPYTPPTYAPMTAVFSGANPEVFPAAAMAGTSK
jgi:hypothetical protein